MDGFGLNSDPCCWRESTSRIFARQCVRWLDMRGGKSTAPVHLSKNPLVRQAQVLDISTKRNPVVTNLNKSIYHQQSGRTFRPL